MKNRILIIEDDKILLDILAKKLRRKGFDVLEATNGSVGLGMIGPEKPDLILLDLVLPGKSGYDILDDIQKDERKEIPVVIISNSGEPVEMERLLSSGVKDYLVKANFDPDEVIEKIEKIFGLESQPSKPDSEPVTKSTTEPVSTQKREVVDILVVEDDQFLRDIMVQKLKKEGFSLEIATDGKQALQSLKNFIPKLVLLDLILPDFDGFEILIRMRKDPVFITVPVIVLSNLGDKENMERAKELGANSYLIKAHYTPDEITEKIREAMK